MSAYRELEARFKRLSDIRGALAVLYRDRAAMMPPGGQHARAEQIATLRQVVHEGLADPRTGELLAAAEQDAQALDAWQAANLREMRRTHVHATALDPDLVAAPGAVAGEIEALRCRP